MPFPIEKIEAMIYTIRGQRVMLDSDLAKLYGVETKVLNQAVKRNLNRFPGDFMLACDLSILVDLRSQIVTANHSTTWNYKRRSAPMLFTENGVAMLSSVLNSERAIEVNIAIMRTFTKLRSFLAMESSIKEEVGSLKKNTNQLFKIVFERLDNLEECLPEHPRDRKRIGLKEI
jgi:hypothetical protein